MSGTGTGVLVSVRLTSLRCLLSDGLRGEGLGIPSPLLGCHGRYGPEGLLQWLVPCWYCWLLCTSCCVPFPGWQAPGAWHSGRHGPEVHLRWHVQSWFSGVYTPRAVCQRRTGKLDYLGDGVCSSSAPCIWKSLVRAVCLRSTGLLIFREIIQESFSIQHSSWFNSGYMFGISLRGLFGRITLST